MPHPEHPAPAEPFVDRHVLPDTALPIHYAVWLRPNLKKLTFDGRVDILVKFVNSTNTIYVNTNDLKIKSASLTHVGEEENSKMAIKIESDAEKEQTSFTFAQTTPSGTEAIISVEFTGFIHDKLAGFYKSEYVDKDGEKKYMAVTQFEPTDARRAFPCWDEPNKKAEFSVTLVVEKQYTALSNMDVLSETDLEGDWKQVKFNKTPTMSTYLIAFVVGEVEFIQAYTRTQIPVRVYAPKGYVHQGKFALDVGTRTLDFFAEYFDQPYPLPKMDMIAIPDFGSGAMENWGLVTYRMTLLLFDEKSSSLKTKQSVAYVVGHELAHQWFGNLVTMEWWSDLWLNEGFATWVGWLASDRLFPEWDIWTEFIVSDLQAGLSLDALLSSHPIEVPVKDPADISQIFDSISYSKGASVIRMLEAYLGTKDFAVGLRNYLKKHKYGNAKTSDLWDALRNASGEPVVEIMNGWTRQVGYPVLTVVETKSKGKFALKIRQNRFLSSGDVKDKDDQHLWYVPLNIRTDFSGYESENTRQLLSEREATLMVANPSTPLDIYKLNANQTGFYRVQYPPHLIPKIGTKIEEGKLIAADRNGILNDAFCLGSAGYQSSTIGLSLLKHFKSEEDYILWTEISAQVNRIKSVWFEEPIRVRESVCALVKSLFSPLVKKLGWEFLPGENDKVTLLRALSIFVAGSNGDEIVIKEAQKRFKEYASGHEDAIHADLRGGVFTMAVRYGGVAEYEAVFKIYQENGVADLKVAALSALSASRDPVLIERTLALSLSDLVRSQDVIYIFRHIAVNEVARRPTWTYVQKNWDAIYERFDRGSISILSSIVSASTSYLTTEQDAEDVEQFFKDKDTRAISRTISQSVEKIRSAAKWLSRDREPVAKWLEENVPTF